MYWITNQFVFGSKFLLFDMLRLEFVKLVVTIIRKLYFYLYFAATTFKGRVNQTLVRIITYDMSITELKFQYTTWGNFIF